MKIRTTKVLVIVALSVGLLGASSGLAANAQFSWTNWQPAVGPIPIMENDLDAQIIQAYNTGLISEFEKAMLSRDLDGIKVQEQVYRMGDVGITPWSEAKVLASLGRFKVTLQSHEAANKTAAQVTTIVQPGTR